MSLSKAPSISWNSSPLPFPTARLGVALAAVSVVAAALATFGWLLAWGVAAQPRNPFGLPLQESSPIAGGLGGVIIVLQAQFYAAMTSAVLALKAQHGAIGALATIGFAYGVFHAAGPGHGKGVISAYVIARGRAISRGLALSLAAALLQAAMAIVLVGVFAIALKTPASSINTAARTVELASFAAVAAFGGLLVWRKADEFLDALRRSAAKGAGESVEKGAKARRGMFFGDPKNEMQEFIAVAGAAGVRPCSGAILLLVFSLSQGLFGAGVVGALAMGLGTSVTTGTLSVIATLTRRMAHRAGNRNGRLARVLVVGFELVAAAFVLTLGIVLLSAPMTTISAVALD